MKKLLFIPISLLFLACSNVHTEGEKNLTEGGDTIAQADIVTSKLDALDQLSEDEPDTKTGSVIFKATGSEPGWFAEFTEHRMRFVFEYGKDSLLLDEDFTTLKNNSPYLLTDAKLKLEITISNTPCTNAKGDKQSNTVTISYHGKPYKGCGELVK